MNKPDMDTSGDNRPGSVLAEAREAAGRTIEDVAIELCISPKHLTAIEANAFDDMGGATYVKGYLRAYARSLGLDPEAIVADYLALGPEEHVITVRDSVESPPRNNLGLLIGAAVVTALLIAGLSVWLMGGRDTETPAQTSTADVTDAPATGAGQWVREAPPLPPTETGVADTAKPSESQRSGAASAEAEISSGPSSAATSGQSADAQAGSKPEAQSASPVAAEKTAVDEKPVGQEKSVAADKPGGDRKPPAAPTNKVAAAKAVPQKRDAGQSAPIFVGGGKDRIELELSQDSWVQIQDRNGAVLLQGLYTAGAHRKLQGSAPFQVFLGNAPGVTIRFNGKEFDSSPYVRSNNTARFALVAE